MIALDKKGRAVSTRSGKEGNEELLAFGRRLGLKKKWLHDIGTYKEHYKIPFRRQKIVALKYLQSINKEAGLSNSTTMINIIQSKKYKKEAADEKN
jgi:hypothetical protein